jgi:non-ribosomal peptide synthetase component E (peptide arylation enzyme)
LADYKAPDRIVLLPSLPLTSMMKVDKAALRELLESESSGPDGSRPKK